MKFSKKYGIEHKNSLMTCFHWSFQPRLGGWGRPCHVVESLIFLCRMNTLQCGYIINVSCYGLPGFGKTLILRSNTNPVSVTAARLRPPLHHPRPTSSLCQAEFTSPGFRVWICVSLQTWSCSTEETRDTVKKPITSQCHLSSKGILTDPILADRVTAWPMETGGKLVVLE